MLNVDKQIAHWRNGAEEDWLVAQDLIARDRIRHGLFFAHLALEKTLKALVCKSTGGMAPPIHNLIRLNERAGLQLTDAQIDLLAEVNEFNIEGRYPEMQLPAVSRAEADRYMSEIDEVLTCLNSLF